MYISFSRERKRDVLGTKTRSFRCLHLDLMRMRTMTLRYLHIIHRRRTRARSFRYLHHSLMLMKTRSPGNGNEIFSMSASHSQENENCSTSTCYSHEIFTVHSHDSDIFSISTCHSHVKKEENEIFSMSASHSHENKNESFSLLFFPFLNF